jgi:uncharacterized membrane protein
MMFGFLFLGWYWLTQKRLTLAGIPLAIAFAVKQSAWPVFPFYLAFLWFKNKDFKKLLVNIFPFGLVFGLLVLPFFLWDPPAFWQGTVAYLSGGTEHSYPIAGYGWGMVLSQWGVIQDKFMAYPFWLWQLAIGLPLMAVLIKWLSKSPKVSRLIFSYGFFTFIFWYFSRYFNNSHLGYLTMVFITGLLFQASQGSKSLR